MRRVLCEKKWNRNFRKSLGIKIKEFMNTDRQKDLVIH